MIATHVSRPIRSASASGPIGCAKPSFATVSIASALGDALHQRVRRLVEERHQDPVRRRSPGSRSPRPASSRGRGPARRSRRPSRRRSARRGSTSTSASTGTGLKKCMPITRSGRDVAAASSRDRDRGRVRGEDGVRGQRLVGGAEERALGLGVLDDRLDQQIGLGELVDGRDAPEHLVGLRAALLVQLAEAPPHRLEAALDRPRLTVVERDLPPGRGDDLCDAGAHLAGADDEDVPKVTPVEATSRRELPWRCRSRRTEKARTSARITSPITTLIALPRTSSLTDRRAPGSASWQLSVVSRAPSRFASTPTASSSTTGWSSSSTSGVGAVTSTSRPTGPFTRWSTRKR